MARFRSLALLCIVFTLLPASITPGLGSIFAAGGRSGESTAVQADGFPLVAELQGQNTSLMSLAFSPDGATVAAAGDKGVIDLWTVADWKSAGTLAGHTAAVNTLAYSLDGTQLASGSDDSTVRIWNPATQDLASQFRPTLSTNIYRLVYSPSGSELAIGGQLCVVQLVNPETGILRRTLDQPGCGSTSHGWVRSWGIDYLPDGGGLLTGDGRGCCGGALFRWDDDRFIEPQLLVGYGLPVIDVVLDPGGSRVAVAALGEPAVWIRDAASGALIHEMIGHAFRVTGLDFSPDGKRVASSSRDGDLVLWDAQAGVEAARLSPQAGPLTDVAFSPDGGLLAATTESGRVLVWDLSGG